MVEGVERFFVGGIWVTLPPFARNSSRVGGGESGEWGSGLWVRVDVKSSGDSVILVSASQRFGLPASVRVSGPRAVQIVRLGGLPGL